MCTILQLGKKAPMFRIFNNSLYFFCSLKNYNLLCHFTVVVVVVALMLLCIVLFAALIQIQNRVNIIRFILKSPSQTSQLSCSVLDYIFVVVFVGLGEGCGSFSSTVWNGNQPLVWPIVKFINIGGNRTFLRGRWTIKANGFRDSVCTRHTHTHTFAFLDPFNFFVAVCLFIYLFGRYRIFFNSLNTAEN